MKKFSSPKISNAWRILLLLAAGTLPTHQAKADPGPTNCFPAPAGLVAYWKGEDDAADSVGDHHGTLRGGATFTAGPVGQAFRFDGVDSYVEVPDSPSLRLTDVLSVEFWFRKHDRFDRPYGEYIINKGGDWVGGKLNYGVALSPPNFGYGMAFLFAGGNRHAGYIDDTNWHHYAVIVTNGAADPVFYIDGTNAPITRREGVDTINLYPSTDPVYIGAQIDPGYAIYYSKASLDDLSLYNRALTPAEVQGIYLAGASGKCNPPPRAPEITSQPQSRSCFIGQTVVAFAASVIGSQPLHFQWQFNGVDIAGANDSKLTLSNPQPGDAGQYTLTVTNSLGIAATIPATLTVNPLPACEPSPDGLVAYWKGEDNTVDSAGNHHGTLHGGATFTAGPVGQAFRFDGVDSYVEVPDSPSLHLTDVLSVEFWFKKYDRVGRPYGEYIINKGGDWVGGQLNYGVALSPPEFGYGMAFLFAGGNRHAGYIDDTNWHHYAVIVTNGAVDPVFYIDGVYAPITRREGVGTINLYPSTEPVYIGAQIDPDYAIYYSKAAIDELYLYNRALTAAEIQGVYYAQASGKCGVPQLTVLVNGAGKVSPPPENLNLKLGKSYVLTAVPAAHNIFSNWLFITDGVTNIISTAKCAFTMPQELTLIANFTTNRFIEAADKYYGLFSDTNGVTPQSAGFASFKTTSSGKFSGKLLLAGQSAGFSGALDASGNGSTLVTRPNKSTLNLKLRLTFDGTERIVGAIENPADAWSAGLLGDRAKKPGGFLGHYTLLLPGQTNRAGTPAGDGYSIVNVPASGVVKMAGKLGDGQLFSPAIATISRNGHFPLYSAHGSNSVMLGWVNFTNAPQRTLTGSPLWIKYGASNGICHGGFSNEVPIVASSYTPPAIGQRGIFITNGMTVLNEGDLPAPITNGLTISDANKITLNTTNGSMTKLTFQPSTGTLKASFVHPDKPGAPTEVSGVYLQDQNYGGGFFTGTNQTGPLLLKKK